MRKAFPGTRVVGVSIALAFGLAAAAIAGPFPVAASGPGGAQASEAVRLINGARAAAGKRALVIDRYLAQVAADGAIPCPDTEGSVPGRARDFATFGYMDHRLRNCASTSPLSFSGVTFVDQLRSKMGYGAAAVGEIIAVNGGYGTGRYTFTSRGWATYTYATTGHAVAGWLTSSVHAGIIMGNYGRVGCGAWWSGSSVYYDCVFAAGGPTPSGTAAAPTSSPFGPMPTPAPTARPQTPRPTRAPTPEPGGGSPAASGAAPSPTPLETPSPEPTPTAAETATAEPSPAEVPPGAAEDGTAPTPTAVAGAAANTMPQPPTIGDMSGVSTPLGIAGLFVGLGGLALILLRRVFPRPTEPEL